MSIEQFGSVLVLAPHTDDGEFGCGGTMARLIEAGIPVTYAAFSTAVRSVPDDFPKDILSKEVREATQTLGIAEPHLRVFDFDVRTTVMGYEIPWNNISFSHQAYVELTPAQVEKKVTALLCYKSQQHRNYASEDYIRNLAVTRGINVGRRLAEVFEVYRWIL